MLHPYGPFLWPLFIPALFFFILTAGLSYRNLSFIVSATKTKGTIVSFESVDQKNSVGTVISSSSAPKVEYVDKNGKTQSVIARVRTNPPSGNVGDKVTIYYKTSDPSNARLGMFKDMWLSTAIFAFLFAIFFIMWFGKRYGPPGSDVMHPAKTTQTIETYGSDNKDQW